MEFLRSLLSRHFAEKPVATSRKVSCFHMPVFLFYFSAVMKTLTETVARKVNLTAKPARLLALNLHKVSVIGAVKVFFHFGACFIHIFAFI